MTLPAKNRRTITVGGKRYHFVFDPFRLMGSDAFVTVQSADGTGRKLFIRWIGLVLPRFVVRAIAFASEKGWASDSRSDMEIGCDSFANPPQFYVKPTGASEYWFHDWWFEEHPDHVFATPLTDYDLDHWK